MLRKILLSSVVVVASGSAFAADLPSRVAPAPYMAAAPIFTWSGFYVGLNAGAGFNNKRGYGYTGFGGVAPTVFAGSNGDDTGFTGGAQLGYNMQFGSIVAGIEADINYIDRNGGSNGVVVGAPAGTYYTVDRSGDNNWFGTVRGRLGYAFDRALIYATGGLAYGAKRGGSTVTEFTGGVAPGVVLATNGGNNNNIGWALGGGLEYAFTPAWSARVEYLHVDLGRNNRTFAATTPGDFITVRSDNKFDVVRAGVNYRF